MKLTFTLFLLFVFNISSTFACRCEGNGTVKQAFENAEVVILGKVVKKSYVSIRSTMNENELPSMESSMDDWEKQMLDIPAVLRVEIEVTKQLKGIPTTENVVIYTARNSSSCGYDAFLKEKTYLIYGDQKSYLYQLFSSKMTKKENIEKSGTFWTSQCTRTTSDYQGDLTVLDSF